MFKLYKQKWSTMMYYSYNELKKAAHPDCCDIMRHRNGEFIKQDYPPKIDENEILKQKAKEVDRIIKEFVSKNPPKQ